MPLTPHGKRQLKRLKKTYKSTKKAKEVLYASKNAGKKGFTDIDKSKRRKKKGRAKRR